MSRNGRCIASSGGDEVSPQPQRKCSGAHGCTCSMYNNEMGRCRSGRERERERGIDRMGTRENEEGERQREKE